MKENKINVTHEWGRLKKTLLGIATDLYLFKSNPTLDYEFVPKKYKNKLQTWDDTRLSEKDAVFFEKLCTQMKELANFLREHEVEVFEVSPLKREELSVNSIQMFIRDPIIIIGNKVFEASMKLPPRFNERYGFRKVLESYSAGKAQPIIVPPGVQTTLAEVPEAAGPFLEGGDVLLAGKDILIGWNNKGSASDYLGAQWLKNCLGKDYSVHLIELNNDFLHLDVGLSLVSENLAVLCKDAFKEGIPKFLDNWEIIELTKKEALEFLAVNLLILGPKEVLIDSRAKLLGDLLSKKGFAVHTLELDAITLFAGGLRCAHHPLIREI